MSHSRAKINLHATAPKYRRRQRELLTHQRRVEKLAARRSRKACAPSPAP